MSPAVHPYLDAPGPIAVAHRGGAVDEGLENTMVAFQRAIDLGYTYLETDVHATRDGVLVAFHDAALDRVTNRAGLVEQLTWTQVRQAKIAGREPIPLLTEVLHSFPKARLSIDPKSDAAVGPLVRILRDRGTLDRVCVGSFDQRRVLRVRRALPGVATSAGPWEVRALKIASASRLPAAMMPGSLPGAGPVCVQVPERHDGRRVVDRAFVETAHTRGLPVHVWTVNDRVAMHRLLDLEVDGIVTDDVTALREVLVTRGQWQTP